MFYEHALPIGTVVTLKNYENEPWMIVGTLVRNENNEYKEYASVNYPYGILDGKRYLLFNHEDIAEVLFEGYRSDKYGAFLDVVQKAEERLTEANSTKNEQTPEKKKDEALFE